MRGSRRRFTISVCVSRDGVAENRLQSVVMSEPSKKFLLAVFAAIILSLAAPAHAFRCKNKLVTDGMHEDEVLAVCGEPASRRDLGYTVRSYPYGWRSVSPGSGRSHWRGHTALSEEILVTEFVYNFGPRKLMRRLVFEGGILTAIETLGYGYIDQGDGDNGPR